MGRSQLDGLSKLAIVFAVFEGVWYVIKLFLLIMIGVVICRYNHKKDPSPPTLSQIEQQVDQNLCRAMVIEAVIAERVRLTGQINPAPARAEVR